MNTGQGDADKKFIASDLLGEKTTDPRSDIKHKCDNKFGLIITVKIYENFE
jgi:hypothetical protein